jgi:SAM-dependent methyltransferase
MPDHWNQHARQWQWLASPLRPASEDIAFAERAIKSWHSKNRASTVNALLLGVTPEIASMQWLPNTRLVAVDRSQAMIDGVWSGDAPGRIARCAEWNDLPVPPASQHIAIGDGCFVLLSYPSAYRAVMDAVRRVLRDDGIFVVRFFVRPETREPVGKIIDDLTSGRIGNFHVFKWRLAMALHGALEDGVRLADIWDAWHAAVPDAEALAEQLGWPLEVVHTIDNYRDVETRYTFPMLAEAHTALSMMFIEDECFVPSYELGACCPTFVLQPR